MRTIEEMKAANRCDFTTVTENKLSGWIQMPGWRGSIIVTWSYGWEHVSVTPNKRKVPTWDDMCYIKDLFWGPEEWVVQYHPSRSEYVNLMPNCLHLWRPTRETLPIPPTCLTGPKVGQTPEELEKEIDALEP